MQQSEQIAPNQKSTEAKQP